MAHSPMADRTPQPQDKYIVRMPEGMREQIKKEATNSGRTMNAEIVHRLNSTLPSGDNYKLNVELEKHLAKEVLATASLHDLAPDRLIAGIIEDHFRGKTSDFSYENKNPDETLFKHQKLILELDRLASELETDFLLYLQKLTQIKLFAKLIVSQRDGGVPAEVLQSANEILDMVKIEEEVARGRNLELISSARREI